MTRGVTPARCRTAALFLLEEQDRSRWDKAQVADGLARVDAVLRAPGRPSSYAVQAAIAALHMRAERYEDTDWPQIAGLYQVLLRIHPSPVVELNHAAAVSMVDGPEAGLRLADALAARGELAGYHLLPALRGRSVAAAWAQGGGGRGLSRGARPRYA